MCVCVCVCVCVLKIKKLCLLVYFCHTLRKHCILYKELVVNKLPQLLNLNTRAVQHFDHRCSL